MAFVNGGFAGGVSVNQLLGNQGGFGVNPGVGFQQVAAPTFPPNSMQMMQMLQGVIQALAALQSQWGQMASPQFNPQDRKSVV